MKNKKVKVLTVVRVFLCYNIFIINRTTSQGCKVNIVNIKENADGFIG